MADKSSAAAKATNDEDKLLAIRVIETQPFTRAAKKVLTDEDRRALTEHVAQFRELGTIIPDTGGLRKLRWSSGQRGKRGGSRVVYYYMDDEAPLYLLTVYRKAAQEDMTYAEKKAARKFVAALKKTLKDPARRRAHLRLIDCEGTVGTVVKVSR